MAGRSESWTFVKILCFTGTLLVILDNVGALNNGLALTPPMGWMVCAIVISEIRMCYKEGHYLQTWQRFRCTEDCKNFPTECIRLGST